MCHAPTDTWRRVILLARPNMRAAITVAVTLLASASALRAPMRIHHRHGSPAMRQDSDYTVT
eukprot:5211451-Prymnesium_polylepis.1